MTKPRLFRYLGLWHCFSGHFIRAGLGFTPRQAYDDWKAIEEKFGLD